ncbi:hypothetical protein ACFPM0_32400 [Pseudonocardia sulfidoxydans]
MSGDSRHSDYRHSQGTGRRGMRWADHAVRSCTPDAATPAEPARRTM